MNQSIHPYLLLAELFEPPRPGCLASAERCGLILALRNPEATRAVARFATWATEASAEQLQEAYRAAFEASPSGCLEVGFQLYGDDYRRGMFLMRIQAASHAHAIAPRLPQRELADHLAPMLRLLAVMSVHEDPRTLAGESVLPACQRLAAQLPSENPYRHLLQAVVALLSRDFNIEPVYAPRRQEHTARASVPPVSDLPFVELSV